MAEFSADGEPPDNGRAFSQSSAPAAPKLRLRLLGRMEAVDAAGTSVLPRVRKTRAMLGVLALADGEPVLRATLAALLWSTRDREQALGSLRQSVHELVECLGEASASLLVAERPHLQLRNSGVDTDARAVMRATVTRPEPLDLLRGGPLFEDLIGLDPAFDRWLAAERWKLTSSAARIAEEVLDMQIAERAPPADTLAAALALVSIDPLRESGWRAAMAAHAAMGERASAMAMFERCAAALAETARISPSAETRALHDAVRAQGLGAGARVQRRQGTRSERGARLGVMPFRVLGAGADDGLSVGLADEITNALARFRSIFLIASPSLAALESGAADTRVGALGLDFLLEGTVQRGGSRIRVTVRLLDMHSARIGGAASGDGEVVWARRFERNDADLFSLQDEVAAETVAQIDPELLLREAHRATALQPTDPTAYELMLRAIPALYRLEESSFRAAGSLLEAAVSRDPDYAPARAWLAYWHVFLIGQGWAIDIPASMKLAGECAERAVALDPADARALTIAGHVRSYLDRQLSDAIEMHERALALNPNLPLAWAFSGLARAYAGQHEEAIRRIGEARRLSPFDPHGFFFETALMVPTLLRGDFEQVVELGRRSIHLNPTLSSTLKGYLSALGHIGPSAEALSVRARLLQAEPGFSIRRALERTPFQREEDRTLYADGLRRAGIPEDEDETPGEAYAPAPSAGPGWAVT